MKTKEAIQNDIIHYANMSWDIRNLNNTHPLVQLMVEEISHELFLLDNKLKEIDYSILCKLAMTLAPQVYSYARPSHALLKINLSEKEYKLDRKAGFLLKQLPEKIKNMDIPSVSYTPATDVFLQKIKIVCSFYDNMLITTDDSGAFRKTKHFSKRAASNTVWIGLDADLEINGLKETPFYVEFSHLPDHHEYYSMLSDTKWHLAGKPLKIKAGFPIAEDATPNMSEKEVLDFYHDHFVTIDSKLNSDEFKQEKIPEDLIGIIDVDTLQAIPPLYWIGIDFPANFQNEDLKKISIYSNTLPVLNRYYNEVEVADQKSEKLVSLSSGFSQEFLNVETISDSAENVYHLVSKVSDTGEYRVFPTRRKNMGDSRILDYLERMVDIIHDERATFAGIDSEKVVHVLNAISSIQNQDTQKIEINRLNRSAEVALLSVKAYENTSTMTISYWTTHTGLLNDIPAGTELMPNKIPELSKSEIVFLTSTCGGRNLYNLETLKAINSFYLISKGRILTKHDILSFCKLELGEYLEKVDVIHKAVISHKQKEGIIIVMEIQVTPKPQYISYFKQKNVFKDLLVRLYQKSPGNFNYRIKLISN